MNFQDAYFIDSIASWGTRKRAHKFNYFDFVESIDRSYAILDLRAV